MVYFSVVIPLFNKEEFIVDTMRSIFEQDFRNFEVIIVDDGSTDKSVERAMSIATTSTTLVRKTNGGPGAARNEGIIRSKGEWIAFIDADDIWLHDHLSTLELTIRSLNADGMVASNFIRSDSKNIINANKISRESGISYYGRYIDNIDRVWSSCIAVKRSVALASGGFGEIWPGEDIEYWFRLSLKYSLILNSRTTAIYRQETGGIMNSGAHSSKKNDIAPINPLIKSIRMARSDIKCNITSSELIELEYKILISNIKSGIYKGNFDFVKEYMLEVKQLGRSVPFLYRMIIKLPRDLVRFLALRFTFLKKTIQM